MVEPREVVLAIVQAHAPGTSFDDELPLGADGLGLDSIAIAEVLLECEMKFGVPFSDLLEDRSPLTVARLLGHLEASAAR